MQERVGSGENRRNWEREERPLYAVRDFARYCLPSWRAHAMVAWLFPSASLLHTGSSVRFVLFQ
jgi:hypothetical protein